MRFDTGGQAISEMSRRGFIGMAVAGSAVPALSAAAQIPEPAQSKVAVESNVVYGKGGDMDLKLDIYRPPAGVSPNKWRRFIFTAEDLRQAARNR